MCFGPVWVDVFARSHQLAAGLLCERVRPEGLEIPVRDAELLACVHPPVPAPQPLPVDQTGAGQVHPDAAAGEPLDGLAVAGVSILVLVYERLGASLNTEGPIRGAGTSSFLEPTQGISCQLALVAAGRRLDQLDQRPAVQTEVVELTGAAGRRRARPRSGRDRCKGPR